MVTISRVRFGRWFGCCRHLLNRPPQHPIFTDASPRPPTTAEMFFVLTMDDKVVDDTGLEPELRNADPL